MEDNTKKNIVIWRQKAIFGGNCQIWLQTQGELWLCDRSRVNHPCSLSGHVGVLWRNVMWWTKSWDELSCHHVTYAYQIWSCQSFFFFFFFLWWGQPPFFLWKQLCRILQQYLFPSVLSGVWKVSAYSWQRYSFNSTVLITFIFLLILFVWKKMFCILPKKTVLYTHVSKCTMFLSLCWFIFH